MATAAPANNGQGENEAPKSDAANDPGVVPSAGSNDINNDAVAGSGNATAPGSGAGVLSSGSGASESDQGAAADKGGDKIDNLNNVGLDSGPSAPVNATNVDAKGPKEVPDIAPAPRINITESQNVPSLNQSATTKSPEVLPDLTTAARPVQEITVGDVFTTAKRTTASTTKETTTEAKTTFKATTEPILIEFPNSAKTDPPYAIVTDSASPGNVTLIGPEDPGASKNGAAIIASSLAGVLILVIIIAVIVFLLFRRKRRQSKEIVQTVENPRYTLPPTITRSSPAAVPHQYRFSRDADISIGQVRTGKVSNNNRKGASPMFGKKGLMTYTPSISGSDISQGSRRLKKRAPAPPNPFGNPDLYERDSNGSGYEMTTFGNVSTFGKGTAPSPPKGNAGEDGVKEPLLNGKAGTKEPKRSGDYSSSSSSSSDEDEAADKSEILKAGDEVVTEHRNSQNYSALNNDDEDDEYNQELNPFSDTWAEDKE